MKVLQNNAEAVLFCVQFVYICHLWDDLIDKDRQRSDAEINDAFRIALVEMNRNGFYRRHLDELAAIINNVIIRWEDANELERHPRGNHDYHLAHGHRAGLVDLFAYCAYLVGGTAWARKVGPEIRRMYQEPLEDYIKEMEGSKNA